MTSNAALGHMGLMFGLLGLLIMLDRLIYATAYSSYNQAMFGLVFLLWLAGAALILVETFRDARPA